MSELASEPVAQASLGARALPIAPSPVPPVDILEWLLDGRYVAQRRVDADDPYLAGHYPGRPIYPGVFLVESVAAVARQLAGSVRVRAVRSARFSAPAFPGDVLTLRGACVERHGTVDIDARIVNQHGTGVARVALTLDRVAVAP